MWMTFSSRSFEASGARARFAAAPAGQVADELADGPPGPGVQHGRQLPEVSQQQELHVGVQPHAGQVRPERHVQLRDLLPTSQSSFCALPPRTYLRTQWSAVLRGAVRLGHQVHRLALLSQPTSFQCPAGP